MQATTTIVQTKRRSLVNSFIVTTLASIFVGLCAPLSIPLWFSPIPLAIQGSVILFLSTFLGRWQALSMVCLFILQGAIGFPVFAGGASGIWHLLGPRGGYILGYAVSAFVVGALTEKKSNPVLKFFVFCLGNTIIYLYGVCWLSQFIGFTKALLLGVCPFIVGDLLKAVFFSCLGKAMQPNVDAV